jgi:hypothetical protein
MREAIGLLLLAVAILISIWNANRQAKTPEYKRRERRLRLFAARGRAALKRGQTPTLAQRGAMQLERQPF